jgi:very-short-patch-repair endonuclease
VTEPRQRGSFTRVNSPHAKPLRKNMTEAEKRLWFHLRDRRLGGHKFRRQVTIDPYIVDFLCVERRLVVEADGSQHSDAVDAARTAFLTAQGYRVIRFWNNDVLARTNTVTEAILAALEGR